MKSLSAVLLTAVFCIDAAAESVFEKVAPAMVRVKAYRGNAILNDASGLVREDFEYGSGFAVGPSLVVTAKHTVVFSGTPSKSIQCWSLRRNRYDGCTVLYVGPDRDIAVLWYPQLPNVQLPIVLTAGVPQARLLVAGFPDSPYGKPRLVIGDGELLSWNTQAPGSDRVPERRNLAAADAMAFGGCSGGPVLTPKLEVIGMVVSIMENDEGQWTGTTYFVRAAEINAAVTLARQSLRPKKGYEFLPPH